MACLWVSFSKVFPLVRSDILFLLGCKRCELDEKLLEPSAFLNHLNSALKNEPFACVFPPYAVSYSNFHNFSVTGW